MMEEKKIEIGIQKVQHSRLKSIDFNQLKFGETFSDHMFVADYEDGEWKRPSILPFQDLSFSPASSVFHYGQAIFEGLKAHKAENGDVLLFRPEQNHKRLNFSARRMCMAEVPEQIFMEGLKKLIKIDREWVPSGADQSLYIRPFLIANQNFLGVRASDNYKFMIITSPVAAYYKGAVKVKIETEYVRAAQGGVGAAKAAGNYAASLYPAKLAKKEGFDQLIWTDAKTHEYIEESGTMNLMLKIGNRLLTPSLESGSILSGITRDSIIKLAKKWGYEVEERKISVNELIESIKNNELEEAFGMGTAATIAPISDISYKGENYALKSHKDWVFSNKVKSELEGIKTAQKADDFGWTLKV